MKKRILEYTGRIDELLEAEDESVNWESMVKEHLVQISFFQHERLVHLIVTVLVAIAFILCFGIAMIAESILMFIPAIILFMLFIPYIFHYYLLENQVQKMYEQYDRLLKAVKIYS